MTTERKEKKSKIDELRNLDVLIDQLEGLSDGMVVEATKRVSVGLAMKLSDEAFDIRENQLISLLNARLDSIDPERKLDRDKYLNQLIRFAQKERESIKNSYVYLTNMIDIGTTTAGITGTYEGELISAMFKDVLSNNLDNNFNKYNQRNTSKFINTLVEMAEKELAVEKKREELEKRNKIEEATRKKEQEDLDAYNQKLVDENAKPKDCMENPLYANHIKKQQEKKVKELNNTTDLPNSATGEEYLRNAEVIRNMTGLSDTDVAIAARRISRMANVSMEANPFMDGARVALENDRKFRIDGSEIVMKIINTSKNDIILMFPTGETTVINSMIAKDSDISREKIEVQYLMYDESSPNASFVVLGSFEYPMPVAGCPPVAITQIGALAFISHEHKDYIMQKYKHDINGLFADTYEYLRNGDSEEFGFRENLLNLSPIHNVYMIRSENIVKIPKASVKTRMKLIQKYLGNRPIDNDTVVVINLQFSKEDFKWDSLGPDGLRPENAYPLMNNSYVPSIYIDRIPIGENEKPLPEGLIGYDKKTGNTYYTNYRTANEYLNKYKTGNFKEVEEIKTKEKLERELKEQEEESKKISYKVKEYVSNDDFKRNATFIGTIGAVALLVYVKSMRGKDEELRVASYNFVQYANKLTMDKAKLDLISYLGKFRIDTSRDDELIKTMTSRFSMVNINKALNIYKQFVKDLGKRFKMYKKPIIFNKIVGYLDKIKGVIIRKTKNELLKAVRKELVESHIIKGVNSVSLKGALAKKEINPLVKSFKSVLSKAMLKTRELRKRLVAARVSKPSWRFTRVNRVNTAEVLGKTQGGFVSRVFGFLKSKLAGLGRLVLRTFHMA